MIDCNCTRTSDHDNSISSMNNADTSVDSFSCREINDDYDICGKNKI